MIARIRDNVADRCKPWIMIAGFVGTSLAGGFGAHRAVIADVRQELGGINQTMSERDAVISSRQDRMEAQIWQKLDTMDKDIKTILVRTRR